MRLRLSILCLSLIGCATAPRDIRAVWTQPSPPPPGIPPPAGFTVTPAQAVAATRDSDALSIKHSWSVYADSNYYYVHDTFLGDSPRRAYAQGVRIHGRTGKIAQR